MHPQINSKKVLHEGKFLRLCENIYTDEESHSRVWESVERTNSHGAVMIIAMLKPSRRVLFVRQFRVPVGKYSIELPAGLLDKENESTKEAALRELYEETGYRAKILKVLEPAYSSPGMSAETITLVFAEIDDTLYPVPPESHNDVGECIETFAVGVEEIEAFLKARCEAGDALEARCALAPYFVKGFFEAR